MFLQIKTATNFRQIRPKLKQTHLRFDTDFLRIKWAWRCDLPAGNRFIKQYHKSASNQLCLRCTEPEFEFAKQLQRFAFWVQPLHWSGSCEKVCVFWEKSECFWTSVLLERAENTKEHSAVCCSPGRGRLTIWGSLIGNVEETRGVFLTDSAFPHCQSYQVAFTVLYMWPDTAAFRVFRQVELFFLNETLFFFHYYYLDGAMEVVSFCFFIFSELPTRMIAACCPWWDANPKTKQTGSVATPHQANKIRLHISSAVCLFTWTNDSEGCGPRLLLPRECLATLHREL